MSDSAFVSQENTPDTEEPKTTPRITLTADEKTEEEIESSLIQAGMATKENDKSVDDAMSRDDLKSLSDNETGDATVGNSSDYELGGSNDVKIDSLSDVPTSISPENGSENGVVYVDESVSGNGESNGEASYSDNESIEARGLPQRETNPVLPDTVTVLEGPCNGKVYLVGTAHFSEQSQFDVEETIRKTQPDVVVLELCQSRLSILSLDEARIIEESKTLGVAKIQQNIKEHGFVQGVMYVLLLSLSAHLTKELGMAPGGEFRKAFREGKKVPGCLIHLGDRPVGITLQRAISSLSLWQKLKLGFGIIFSKESITKEEVERCKQRDLLEEMLAEITGEFPAISQVFVDERDKYLTYSLQLAASPVPDVHSAGGLVPQTVVGVVGIGHVPGIIRNWGKVTDADIPPLLEVKPPSKCSRIVVKTIKYSVGGLLAYGVYRYCLPAVVTEACGEVATKTWTAVHRAINK
ncbi:TraB domain-containing protein [Halotydeus destructor]|nr:TraB domain-containing protein [Halotydeus destructor]